jgi:hypothetical protein
MEFSDDAVLRTRFRDRQLNILIRVIRILDSIVGH